MIDLLDFADITQDVATGWQRGGDEVTTAGVITVEVVPICPPGSPVPEPTIVMPGGGSRLYATRPVFVSAALDGPVACSGDDDPGEVNLALLSRLDLALGQVLVTEPVAGVSEDAVWIGHPDVASVSFTGTPLVDVDRFGDAVMAARSVWVRKVAGDVPVLHLAPELVPALLRARVLAIQPDGSVRTVMNETVVVSDGYSSGGAAAFWSGPISAFVSDVDNTGNVHDSRQNRVSVRANFVALLDVAPQSIVRVAVTP